MHYYSNGEIRIAYKIMGHEEETPVIWAHGWGQNHMAFMNLAQSMGQTGHHILVDFPGFGHSPLPDAIWGTEDYADIMAKFIQDKFHRPVLWIGHSFGCRVGLQLAARYPMLVAGLFLLSAAGLPPRKSFLKKCYLKGRVRLFKFLKKFAGAGISEERLYNLFGSADYRRAGPLRSIFVKVVNENLSTVASSVACPVTFVYGTLDKDTPLDIGERFHKLIPHSKFIKLEGLDHYTVLTDGRHRVAPLIKVFLKS